MPKYRVNLGAFVTKLMHRSFVVSGLNEDIAIEKAKDRFEKACARNRVFTEVDTIEVDGVEPLKEGAENA